jgi:hypothetical protein
VSAIVYAATLSVQQFLEPSHKPLPAECQIQLESNYHWLLFLLDSDVEYVPNTHQIQKQQQQHYYQRAAD